MSQNMINDLTDRVSALTADNGRLASTVRELEREVEMQKTRADSLLSEGRVIIRTAEGLQDENKRLKAERNALRAALHALGVRPSVTAEVMIKARNKI